MADRYFHVDVSFLHKKTCRVLREELGPIAPLVWLAVCAQAKVNNPPGSFTYENEILGWSRLGFTGWVPEFTLEEFFAVTGRLKQTRKTRNTASTHCTDVAITQYGRWQKDGKRQVERDRKSRKRAENTADTERTHSGTDSGHETGRRTRSRSIPLTPTSEGTTHPHDCPQCGARQASRSALEDHIRLFHSTLEDAA